MTHYIVRGKNCNFFLNEHHFGMNKHTSIFDDGCLPNGLYLISSSPLGLMRGSAG